MTRISLANFAIAAVILIVAADPASSGVTQRSVISATGAESWEIRTQGIFFSLTQILPDQVRGFYGARGFDEAATEEIARVCVFQTVLRNDSVPQPIRYRLTDWRARMPDDERAPRPQEAWQAEWERRGVSPGARTAFRWALFPSEHTYATGDWNMGMTLFPLPLGSRFDVRVVWYVAGKRHEALLEGVRCATDTAPPSSGPAR